MTFSPRLVLLFVLGFVSAGSSQSQEKATASYQELIADPSKSAAVVSYLDAWLDGDGFDRLREHLKKQSEDKKLTIDELRAMSAVWRQLGDDEAALALVTRAAESKDAPAIAWLERARSEARVQRFKEAATSLDHIADDADAGVVRPASELRTSIARQQGNSEQVSAKLRTLAAARPDDTEIQMMSARWEMERGSRTRLIPLLKQRVSDEKNITTRERWRQLLIESLQYDGKNEDLVRTAMDGILASKAGSEAEADYVGTIASVFYQRRFEAPLNPSPDEVAKSLTNRPAAVLSMIDVMKSRGETAAALEMIAQLAKARPDDVSLHVAWSDELADIGRFDEAITVLKTLAKGPGEAVATVRMAMILREAGREAEGAKLLQDWAVTPKPDEARVRKTAALLPLFLPDAEAKKWSDTTVKNLPARDAVEIRKAEAVEVEPSEIKAIKESDDDPKRKIERLLDLRRQRPRSDAVAAAVITAFGQTGREAEAWHVMLSHHDACKTSAAVRNWWRRGFADRGGARGLDPQRVLTRLQALRRERGDDVLYWTALAEVARLASDNNSQIAALTEVLRLTPGDKTARLSIAEAIADSGHPSEAERAVMPLMATDYAAKARLLLTSLRLKPGGIAQAGRTLTEVIDDPALDGGEVEDIALRFMGWQEWRAAAAFLAAQRSLRPKNYRLAFLHGIALKGQGARDEAVEVFLSMSGFREEMEGDVERSAMMRRYFGYDRMPEQPAVDETTAAWTNISRFVAVSLRDREVLRSAVQERRSRSLEQTFMMAPMRVGECGPRAMAKLLDLTKDLDAKAKTTLVDRARAAGLPFPEALTIGRLEFSEQNAMLVIDEAALSSRLAEPSMAKLWVMQHRFASDWQGKATKPSEDEPKLARQCFATLLPVDATTAMHAAMQWWRSDAASEDAIAAVVQCVQKAGGDQFEALSALGETMRSFPQDICRAPKRMSALLDALLSWRERSAGKGDETEVRAAYMVAPCLAAMGRWQDLAAVLDESAAAVARTQAQRQESANRAPSYDGERYGSTIPRWAYLQTGSPLVWSLEAAGAQNQSLFGMLPRLPGGEEYRTGVSEEDRVSFSAAGKIIKDHQLRLSWAMAARDEKQTIATAREWAKAEPANPNAVLLVACVEAHEEHGERALDLLHALIGTQKDEEARRAAQVIYLRAVFFTTGQTPFNEQGRIVPRTPPKAQEKRVATILRSLQPALMPIKTQLGDTWSALFEAAGLKEGATAMAVSREQRNRGYGSWQQEDRDFFERLSARWNRRRHDERIAPYHIERFLKDVPRERVVTLCLTALRAEADELFLAEQQRGPNIEEWQRAVAAQDIASGLMKAADPGTRRSFRQLVHAMHVAAVCKDAKATSAFGEEALKLRPAAKAVETAVFQARQRAGGNAAEAVTFFKGRAPAEAREQITRLLNAAQSSSDISQRLKLAEAIVKLAAEKPDIFGTNLTSRGSSRIISQTFRLLTDPVRIRECEVPALFPDFRRSDSGKEKPNPEGEEELATRKRLHGELCDIAIKHPEWADESLGDLSIRHLTEDKPDAAEISAYFNAAMKDRGTQKAWIFENWMRQGAEWRKTAHRLKLARLGLNVLPDLRDEDESRSGGFQQPPLSLAQLIGDQIREPGWTIPLYALWEQPGNIDEGTPVYTPDQISLNKERQEIFTELWKQVEKNDRWIPQMLPQWAAFRLHGDTGKTEVLARMRKLKDTQNDPFLLRGVMNSSALSYSMESHVALAEVVEALLRDSKSLLDRPDTAQLIDQVMKLLSKGREHEIERPSLTASPEEAAKQERGGIPAALQKRRQAVHAALQEIVGDRFPKTPEALFTRLENELRAGKETAKTEKLLIELTKTERAKLAGELRRFIDRTEGKRRSKGSISGYEGGVWDIHLRIRWFEAALRIGKPLLENFDEDRDDIGWLDCWLRQLDSSNQLVKPVIPPVSGYWTSSEFDEVTIERLRAATPALKRRGTLFHEGLDLIMSARRGRKAFFNDYTASKLERNPPDVRGLEKILRTIQKDDPEALNVVLDSWLGRNSSSPTLTRFLATFDVVTRLVEDWPKSDSGNSKSWVRSLHEAALGKNYFRRDLTKLPLLPGTKYDSSSERVDISLETPGAKDRHEAWVKFVEAAALKSSLAADVFVDFARLHVVEAPDRVIACARLVVKADPERLGRAFSKIYGEEEAAAPVDRRMAWGRLVLQMIPRAKEFGATGDRDLAWLSATLKFVKSDRPNYSNLPPVDPPAPEVLRQRDELVAVLAGQMTEDPALAIESLIPFAQKQFVAAASPETVVKLVRAAMKSDLPRVKQQLQAWCSAMVDANSGIKEREWAAQTLLQLAEAWPQEQQGESSSWMRNAGLVIAHGGGKTSESSPNLVAAMERLMDTALKRPVTGASLVSDYAATKTGLEKMPERVLTQARTSPALAAEWMNGWWSGRNFRLRETPDRLAAGNAAVRILQNWPVTAPAETMLWVHSVLHELAYVDPKTRFTTYRNEHRSEKNAVPGAPADKACHEIAAKLMEELTRRKIAFEWLSPARLRLALTTQEGEKRKAVFDGVFKSQRERDQVLAYLERVLNPPPKKNEWQFTLDQRISSPLTPDPKITEIFDAAECIRYANERGLVAAATSATLLEHARSRLREIIARPRADPNSYTTLGRENEVSPGQSDAAVELLKALVGTTAPAQKAKEPAPPAGQSGPIELPPELLASHLDDGLRAGQKAAELAEVAWQLLQKEPAKSERALVKWASNITQAHRAKSYIAAGDVALNLAERWTEKQPPPNWLVRFVRNWPGGTWVMEPGETTRRSADLGEHGKARERVLPRLVAILKTFPTCHDLDYFPIISSNATRSARNDGEDEELATLALAHIKAQGPDSLARMPAPLPMLDHGFDFKRQKVPLFSDLVLPDAHIFLLEHAWRKNRDSWFNATVIPAIENSRWLTRPTTLTMLADLYFCEKKAFGRAAQDFAAECWQAGTPEQGVGAIWILRVAQLRGMEISPDAWAGMTDASTRISDWSGRTACSKLTVAWLAFRFATQKELRLGDDLLAFMRAAVGKRFPKRTDPIPLEESFLRERDNDHYSNYHAPRFRDSVCDWIWDTLKAAIEQPEFYGAALRLADETGLLAERTCGENLLHIGMRSSGTLPEERMKRILEVNLLSGDSLIPSREWLMTTEGISPIWSFTSSFESSTKRQAIKWLSEDALRRPAIGKALVILGLGREKGAEITSSTIAATLSPHINLLKSQPAERLSPLTSSLLAVQPRLMDARSKSDAATLLKHLPAPAPEPAVEAAARRWMAAATDKAPGNDSASSPFAPLAVDMCRLLRSHSPRTEPVFDAATKTMAAQIWKGKNPSGVDSLKWAREQALRALIKGAQNLQSVRSYAINGNTYLSPVDENRQCIPYHVIRFIIRHAPDATMAVATPDFDRFVEQTWSKRLGALAWDGDVAAKEILDLSSGEKTDHSPLLLHSGFSKACAAIPFATLEKMAATASEISRLEGRGHVSAWMLRCVLENEKQRRTGAKSLNDILPTSLLEEAKAFWQAKDLPPAARSALARIVPTSIRVDDAKGLLSDWTQLMFTTRPWGSTYDNASWNISGHLAWLASFKDKASIQGEANAAIDVMTEWLTTPRDQAIYFTAGSLLNVYHALLAPLGDTVEAPERRRSLMTAAANAKRLTFPDILDELRLAPPEAPATAVAALFSGDEGDSRRTTSFTKSLEGFLTREDEQILERLRDVPPTSRGVLAARLVISAVPDSAESPPKTTRTQRVTSVVQELASKLELGDAALDELTSYRDVPEELLAELLPLFRRHSSVKRWLDSGTVVAPSSSSSPARFARTLSLWSLAETLHGGKPDAWKQIIVAFKKQADSTTAERTRQTQASISKTPGYSRSLLESGDSANWQRASNSVISHATEWWLDQHPPADWPQIVSPLIDTTLFGVYSLPLGVAKDASLLLRHELPSFSTKTLDDAFASQVLSRAQSSSILWKKILSLKLTAAERWQHLALRRDAARLFTIELSDNLLADASTSGLLTAEEFATVINDAPLQTLQCQPAALADWLISAGRNADALGLIRRLVASAPKDGPPDHWFILAVMALDLGDRELASRASNVGDALRPGTTLSHAVGRRLSSAN